MLAATSFLYVGLGGRPFWNSAIVAARFQASAFAAGPALIIISLEFARIFAPKGVTLGVTAPIGAANIGAQYTKNSTTDDSALELFANYAFSKRTQVYFDTVRVNKNVGADVTRWGVGIQHNF